MKRLARTPLPLATGALVAAILAVFAVELAGDGSGICRALGFTPAHPSLESALTSLFVHDPSGFGHVGGNVASSPGPTLW